MGLSGPTPPDHPEWSKSSPQPSVTRLNKLRARLLSKFRPRHEILKRAAELQLRCVAVMLSPPDLLIVAKRLLGSAEGVRSIPDYAGDTTFR